MAPAIAVLGIVVGLVLLCYRPNADRDAVLNQAPARIREAEHARAAATMAIEGAKATAHVAEREAEVAMSRASAARGRARVVAAGEVIVSGESNAGPVSVRVPAPVVDRMELDSIAVATLGTLVQRKETLIVAQDLRIAADSIELVATSNAFHALERVKEPRCGRRCGIFLGVGSMVAAAVAVEQVRRMIR
jgi:hypothetical protein